MERLYGLESELGQFLGGYLGQDWDILAPDPWSVVEIYVAECPEDARRIARAQLRDVLEHCETEAELAKASEGVHMDLYPPGLGMTYREWLTKVERYLADHETT